MQTNRKEKQTACLHPKMEYIDFRKDVSMRKKADQTLAAIAQKAGVSISTVSRCLNNRGQISAETRQRVLELARAISEPAISNETILVILPAGSELGWYTFFLLQELRKIAVKRGILLEVIFADNYKFLQEHNFCGIISLDYFSHLETLLGPKCAIPLICLNNPGNSMERVYSICSDEYQGMREALVYLIAHNHRDIGLLLFRNDCSVTAQNREKAFLEIMTDFKLSGRAVVGRYVDDPVGSIDILRRKGVTALISPAESPSLKLFKAFHAIGCDIPGEMSLITGEISYISGFLKPALSTLEHDFEKLAVCAFDTIGTLRTGESIPLLQKVDYRLNKRDSVALSPVPAELLE